MDAARAEPDESTSLLASQTDATRGSNERNSPIPRQRLLQKQVLLLALVLAFLKLHSVFFSVASHLVKLRNVCYRFDKEHHPNELSDGKLDGVIHCYFEDQIMQQMREFLNWEQGISSIVLLLAVVPYGKVADFRGKKMVITLALVGQLLYCLWTVVMASFPDLIPLKLVWFAPAFWLIGGGTSLSITLTYLLASESLHEEQRTQAYFSLHAVPVVIEVFVSSVAYLTGIPSVYIPFFISLAFLGGCLVVLKFVGESTIQDNSERPGDAESTATQRSSAEEPAIFGQVSGLLRFLLTFLRSNRVIFALLAFVLPAFAQTALRTLTYYAIMIHGPRHGHISDILVSLSCGGLFRAVFFALIVPLALPFVQKRFGIRQSALNVSIIRGSILTLAIAGAYVTVASGYATRIVAAVLLAMGSGLEVSLLSYIASLAEVELRGRLYGAVQVVETIGQLITWPIADKATWANYHKYNIWIELPFIVMAVTSFCVLTVDVFSRYRFK